MYFKHLVCFEKKNFFWKQLMQLCFLNLNKDVSRVEVSLMTFKTSFPLSWTNWNIFFAPVFFFFLLCRKEFVMVNFRQKKLFLFFCYYCTGITGRVKSEILLFFFFCCFCYRTDRGSIPSMGFAEDESVEGWNKKEKIERKLFFWFSFLLFFFSFCFDFNFVSSCCFNSTITIYSSITTEQKMVFEIRNS
jgi:hypothetical protein